MNKIYIYLGLFLCLFYITSCTTKTAKDVKEDYSKFIKLKPAEQPEEEPGTEMSVFPKKPGELGFTIEKQKGSKNKKTYTVNYHIEYELSKHSSIDLANYTEIIWQYLDKNNKLVVKKETDNTNHIMSPEYKPLEVYPDDIQIKKHSGDPVYYAFFLNPYGNVYLDFIQTVTDDETGEEISSSEFYYSEYKESYHITEFGKDFIISSKVLYLP